ncbi:MAG: chemotaxis protein CheW [Desulfobulbaceae bacterium]|nr:chemotaxis protein CheW [Desulfobulbaceae bacterium]
MFRQVEENPVHRLVRCNVNEESYFMEMTLIRSIQRIERLRLYRSDVDDRGLAKPEGALGYVTVQEGNVPVFSLAKLLGRPLLRKGSKQDLSLKRIVVLSARNERDGLKSEGVAVLVDRVSQVVHIEQEHILSLPHLFKSIGVNSFSGVVSEGESMTLLLSPDELMASSSEHAKQKTSVNPFSAKSAIVGRGEQGEISRSSQKGKGRLLIFSTERDLDVSLCLSISQVSEIMRQVEMIPVPLAPGYLYGIIKWRNKAVPVVDLGYLLGLKRVKDNGIKAEQRLMIARGASADSLIGFPVNSDIRAQNLPADYTHCERPVALNHELVHTIVEMNQETLVMPDISLVAC